MLLTSLTLTNFRQFDTLSLTFEKPWTLIVGPNAGGKSTILESLYMLSHGESPWESNHCHIIKLRPENKEESTYKTLVQSTSRIEADVCNDDEESTNLALSFTTNNGVTTKQYLVDGKATTRNKFLSHFHTILFSPDLIDLLMFEPSQRRSFLDFYTAYLFPELRDIILSYQKVLRHRNSVLKSIAAQRYSRFNDDYGYKNNGAANGGTNGNGAMLGYWTTQLIDLGSQIIYHRLKLIEMLNQEKSSYPTSVSYLPTIALPVSTLESRTFTRSTIKDTFSQRIEMLEEKEKMAGKTLAGPHRDDWHLAVKSFNVNRYGSRGEKRVAIADIIFKLNDIFKETFQHSPILLLDDIASELDSKNTTSVYRKKLGSDQQTVITATSLIDFPKDILDSTHVIQL